MICSKALKDTVGNSTKGVCEVLFVKGDRLTLSYIVSAKTKLLAAYFLLCPGPK